LGLQLSAANFLAAAVYCVTKHLYAAVYCETALLLHYTYRYVDEDEEEEGSNFDLSALDGGSQFGDEGGMGGMGGV
jgi:hypothetical protein